MRLQVQTRATIQNFSFVVHIRTEKSSFKQSRPVTAQASFHFAQENSPLIQNSQPCKITALTTLMLAGRRLDYKLILGTTAGHKTKWCFHATRCDCWRRRAPLSLGHRQIFTEGNKGSEDDWSYASTKSFVIFFSFCSSSPQRGELRESSLYSTFGSADSWRRRAPPSMHSW
jgi:hypothetical protein